MKKIIILKYAWTQTSSTIILHEIFCLMNLFKEILIRTTIWTGPKLNFWPDHFDRLHFWILPLLLVNILETLTG